MANLDDTTNPAGDPSGIPPGTPPGRLIAAKKVQNATVYNTALEKLGTLEDVMIDKETGRIAYAILAHGGFLGIGDQYYPLPWEKLRYDREMGGYIVDIGLDVLQGAPSYTDQATASWHDDDWSRSIYTHYGVEPFWPT